MDSEERKPLLVGYAMKPEREKSFVKRNALPAQPVKGICFRRIDFNRALEPQLAGVDVVLHRMMDELQSVDWAREQAPIQAAIGVNQASSRDGQTLVADEQVYVGDEGDSGVEPMGCGHNRHPPDSQASGQTPREEEERDTGASFSGRSDVAGRLGNHDCFQLSAGHLELERYCAAHPELRIVDPFDRVRLVMDRFAIHDAIRDISLPGLAVTVRAPKAIRVLDRDVVKLKRAMADLKVTFPCIMKPRVACGTPESHTMALLLNLEGLVESRVALPASVQEYVDHGGLQHKVYVLGSKLFHTPRVSMPDAREVLEQHPGEAVVTFDSLRSPLTAAANHPSAGADSVVGETSDVVDERALEGIASWLRTRLGLTLFGFDVVVQAGTRDHVVVDVNYFPSFKDVADDIAVPSFWDALAESIDSFKS